MNKENFEKLIRYIETEAPDIDMDDWVTDTTACGTVGCIAGTIHLMWAKEEGRGWTRVKIKEYLISRSEGYADPAADWLGISYEAATELFYAGCWPARLQMQYHMATTAEERKAIVIERLRDFMSCSVTEQDA